MEQEALEKQKAASASTETDVEPCYFEHEDGTHPSFRTETDVDPCYTEPEDTREDKTRTGRRSSIRRSHRDNYGAIFEEQNNHTQVHAIHAI